MTVIYCPVCYGLRRYCRRCKTRHCQCSWNQCKRAALQPGPEEGR